MSTTVLGTDVCTTEVDRFVNATRWVGKWVRK